MPAPVGVVVVTDTINTTALVTAVNTTATTGHRGVVMTTVAGGTSTNIC